MELKMELWRPKSGELVQVWDHYAIRTGDDAKISNHGDIGYIVGVSKRTDSFKDGKGQSRYLANIVEGDVFKVILFGDDNHSIIHVHQDNIRRPSNESK